MKTTAIQALIAILFTASTTSAGCYSGGQAWDNKGTAAWHAGRACRGYDGKAGALQGWYTPGETKYVCVDGGFGVKYEFQIGNRNYQQGFDINDDDCANRLSDEIWGCNFGGQSEIAGWFIRSDPNSGRC